MSFLKKKIRRSNQQRLRSRRVADNKTQFFKDFSSHPSLSPAVQTLKKKLYCGLVSFFAMLYVHRSSLFSCHSCENMKIEFL